jgi:ribosomal-protein-alanine N-acetyltransferase
MTPTALAATHRAAFVTERPWTSIEFADLLHQRGVILTGRTDSFVLGRVTLDEAEVLTVATQPAMRRQGFARKALADFLSTATAAGASSAFLEVASDNLDAIRLYRSAGFAQVGLRRAYYTRKDAPAANALVLRRTLTLS